MKKPMTEKDAKTTSNYFSYLSIACLSMALVFMIIDGINKNFDFHPENYFLAIMGIVCFALGQALSNGIRVEILEKRLADSLSKEESK